jgi:BirA family transcriptional regulator, biotin operon repressor / biotin---[acetyl-CoA-carboxylase] ligase
VKAAAGQRLESHAGDIDRLLLASFLKSEEQFLSGADLSSAANVSRTTVWKRIEALREHGFLFQSVPSRGYRLVTLPDFLHPAAVAAGMATVRLGGTLITYTETGSTNAAIARLGEEGGVEGTVVLAESQFQGKGRLGRVWASPPGVNLYASVLLRPPISPLDAPQLTFLSVVALARTIRSCTSLVPVIKWPNDILVNGMKVAGLLNEMTAETDRVATVVLGIGVNLNMTREQFPGELRHPASSLLLEGGVKIDRIAFTRRLLEELDQLYVRFLDGGYVAIREEWISWCGVINRRVRIDDSGAPSREGVAVGIDESGALLLQRDDGRVEAIYTGDVSLCG